MALEYYKNVYAINAIAILLEGKTSILLINPEHNPNCASAGYANSIPPPIY